MQEKSALNFPFNTQVQEKSVENGSWIAVKALIGRRVRVDSGKAGAGENDSWLAAKTLATLVFRVDSGKNGPGDILQSDISHLQLNTLLCVSDAKENWVVIFIAFDLGTSLAAISLLVGTFEFG